jgi:DNA invertase Pin-like site-specific DNA recombinase
MKNFVRAYLRASTNEQDAQRAKMMLEQFSSERELAICNYYIENESGAKLNRPELFRLLNDCHIGDILLVEDIDRLSRLNAEDWESLKTLINIRQVRIVAVNVPTTWHQLSSQTTDFDGRMLAAINSMLLDMLAAIARRDYEQRRQRQAQGIVKAKAEGKYKGKRINLARYNAIQRMIANKASWSEIQKTLGCSRKTISKAIKYNEMIPKDIR